MNVPACFKSTNRAFYNPDSATPLAVSEAIRLCEKCPILKDCAVKALTAGTSLCEDYHAPANGVIQAGIVCGGDIDTAFRLAAIAGVPVPDVLVAQNRRSRPGDTCRSCLKPMVRWNRYDEQPQGYVMHYARGFCTNCRKPYEKWVKENNMKSLHRGLRKQVDRKRHIAPPRKSGTPTVQLNLFETA